MRDKLSSAMEFVLQLDALKLVKRRTYISGGERLENSAEHSWHLAMACWAFAELLDKDFDMLRLIQLALVHDLGEVGAGDTFLYDKNRDSAHVAERKSVAKIALEKGNPIPDLLPLWDEQEEGRSKEAKVLKVIDRLLPFLHNMQSEGRAWKDHDIRKSQVLGAHQFIEDEYPDIYSWFLDKLNVAVAKGWLIDA